MTTPEFFLTALWLIPLAVLVAGGIWWDWDRTKATQRTHKETEAGPPVWVDEYREGSDEQE
jgi:cytochrome c-type biogenesis protein CcmH/NrfF